MSLLVSGYNFNGEYTDTKCSMIRGAVLKAAGSIYSCP